MRPATDHAQRARLLGLALVVVSAFGFGSGSLFAKPVYGMGVDWLTLMWWRFLIAAALSWGWLLTTRANRDALRSLSTRRVIVLLVLGVLYVGNTGSYYAALETIPASLAALIVYVYPALVAVLSLRFARRLEGRRAWLALGMSTAGVALAVGGISSGAMPPIQGLLLAVASPTIYAVWIILAARLGGERPPAEAASAAAESDSIPPGDAEMTPEATSPAPAAALMMTATAGAYLVALVVAGRPFTPASIPDAAWPGIVGIATLATAVAVQGFYAGARRIGAARASLVSTVEPIYTIVLASLLLGESLTLIQLLGGVLVIAGVLLAQLGQSGRASDPPKGPVRALEAT